MNRKNIIYYLIKAIFFAGNIYLVYSLSEEWGFIELFLVSIVIAVASSKIAEWIVEAFIKAEPDR